MAKRVTRKDLMAARLAVAEEMTAEEVDKLRLVNRRLERTIKHLKEGSEEMERIAGIVAEMDMGHPWSAILHARKSTFGDQYEGLPLCPLEDAMAQKGNAVRLVYAYELLRMPIKQQLEALRQAPRGEAQLC